MRVQILFGFLLGFFLSSANAKYPETTNGLGPAQSTANSFLSKPVVDNKELWQQIKRKPELVSIRVQVDAATSALLTLKGKYKRSLETYKPQAIDLTFSDGRKQHLKINGSIMIWMKNEHYPYLKLEDLNFDGHLDLQVFDNAGVTGNFWYTTWLYTNGKGFVFSKSLSEVSSPKRDERKKQIRSYYRFGGREETITYFQVHGQSILPMKYVFNQSEDCQTSQGCVCRVYKKEFAGKKWRITKFSEDDLDLYEIYNRQ